MRSINFLIITGMSGAGKGTAIKFFEDRGYFCIDNLPANLIINFLQFFYRSSGNLKKLVFGIDIRGSRYWQSFWDELELLKSRNISYKIIFLDSDTESLLNRFKETRRRHPVNAHPTLLQNIEEERNRLKKIKDISNVIVDTSHLSQRELIAELEKIIGSGLERKLKVNFISFGYKFGLPTDADIIFDVRFLKNPFYVPELKHKTGETKEVSDYIFSFEESREFCDKIIEMLKFLIPNLIKEGRYEISVGIGCTGGMHRSVAFVNAIKEHFKKNFAHEFNVYHRELKKLKKSNRKEEETD